MAAIANVHQYGKCQPVKPLRRDAANRAIARLMAVKRRLASAINQAKVNQ